HDLCLKYAVTPTYLVTSEVCGDRTAVDMLRSYRNANEAEIGSHLHLWTTPPFHDEVGLRYNDRYHGFVHEVPESLLQQKVEHLTSQVSETFGHRPTSFRSGRFGVNAACFRILLENGYTADSSVTPYVDWSHETGIPGRGGGPDFSRAGAAHYPVATGEKRLVEFPVTILPTKLPFTTSDSLTRWYGSWGRNRIVRGLKRLSFGQQPVWLRPFPSTSLSSLKEVTGAAQDRKLQFITMMFHSSELKPGCSPYRKDQESVESLFRLLEEFFAFLLERRIPSVTLSAAAALVGTTA
ncbi:MAG TPA: hypothetical protein VMM37_05970, partial [Bacteroidota bacterium]|nr:hypothetical protein [Bacteroidota bacterium]